MLLVAVLYVSGRCGSQLGSALAERATCGFVAEEGVKSAVQVLSVFVG